MSSGQVSLPDPVFKTPFLQGLPNLISLAWQKYFNQIQVTQNNQNVNISGISTAVVQITQVSTTQGNLPTNPSVGLEVLITDYNHVIQWNGSAWVWGPGELGSGYFGLFMSAPVGKGWHICDGSTVKMLNQNGTTTQVTLPNYATAAYLKMGTTTSAGPNAASGTTASVSAGTPSGTLGNESADLANVAVTGAATAAGSPHTHTFTGAALAAHAHGPGTLDLSNSVLSCYFRQ